MRIIVAGDYKNPILLDTSKFTAVLIQTDDGEPTVIYKMTPDGKGFLRLTKGEDKFFEEHARQLNLK
jgi:hypothetical protein